MNKITFFSAVIILAFTKCANDGGEEHVLVRTVHAGKPVDQATVYVKFGIDQDPQVPLAKYDVIQRGDGSGESYFTNLPKGKNYFFSRGFDQDTKRYVQGAVGVMIGSDSNNKLTIQLY